MPKPNTGESKEDFISRFMSSAEAKRDYPDEKQRYAVAMSMWEDGYGKKRKMDDEESYSPTAGMKEEARKGLEWRREFGRGGTDIGVARARDIVNGKNLSADTIKRMHSFFSRHEVDKQATGFNPGEDGYPSAGRIAWALWGGDAGKSWAAKISRSRSRDCATMFDAAPVSGIRRTDDGYLVAEARVARTGIQLYRGSDIGLFDKDIVRVYRPPEEVFSRDAMRTYAHRPVTMEHPSEMVDASNWKQTAIGQTGEDVVREGEYVRVPLVLMDGAAISAVEGGKRELSMGYTAEIEIVDGVTPEGEPYDAVQRNLRMNHLAVVAKARGGSNLKIGDTRNHGGVDMADAIKTRTVLVDGLPIETTDAGAQAIEKLQGQIKQAEQSKMVADAAHQTAIEAKDAELAKKDAEIDDLKSKVLDEAALDARVAQRADLITKAKKLVDGIETDGKSDAEIRKAVVAAKLGDERIKDKSQAYIDASFDLLLDQAEQNKDSFKKALAKDGDNTHNVSDADPDKAYAENVASLTDAWKRKEA